MVASAASARPRVVIAAAVGSLLGTRMSFWGAVVVVVVAILLLVVWMAVSLVVRARQLRRPGGVVDGATPYGSLIGRSLADSVGDVTPAPSVVVFLSAGCRASDRLLRELSSPGRVDGIALAWTDLDRPGVEARWTPPGVAVLDDGPSIAARLGIRVTPFAVFVGPYGRIEAAAPIGGAGQVIKRSGDSTGPRVERLAAAG